MLDSQDPSTLYGWDSISVSTSTGSSSEFVRSSSTTHGVPTRKGAITARQFPEAPGPEHTDTSGGDGVARQCGLVGDSQNDEQWSDDLSNSSSR